MQDQPRLPSSTRRRSSGGRRDIYVLGKCIMPHHTPIYRLDVHKKHYLVLSRMPVSPSSPSVQLLDLTQDLDSPRRSGHLPPLGRFKIVSAITLLSCTRVYLLSHTCNFSVTIQDMGMYGSIVTRRWSSSLSLSFPSAA